MQPLALLVGLFVAAIGVLGIVAPQALLASVGVFLTPLGLYLAAALRIAIGIVLLRAAPSSRAPRALRLLGLVIVVAGLVTPLFGVDRARAIFAWWSSEPPVVMRSWAGFAVAFGAFIVYAVAPGRRTT